MSASTNTIDQIMKILREELTQEKMIILSKRLYKETTSNASYMETTRRLYLATK